MYEFEYDRAKSQLNLEKHGIDFETAKAIWEGEFVELSVDHHVQEPRFLNVGEINGKYWTAVITKRGGKIRIISVRRSRDREIESYEQRHERQTRH